nr:MAG TPA: hypothetical protein [Caudoviricetes sp.]
MLKNPLILLSMWFTQSYSKKLDRRNYIIPSI